MVNTLTASKDAEETTEEAINCIVLFGYGRVAPTYKNYVDGYLFVGGVGKDIPRVVAKNWQDGKTADGKPSKARIKLQAVLPEDATEGDFIKATGLTVTAPNELAAMISATDAAVLVKAMGRKKAVELAEALLKHSSS